MVFIFSGKDTEKKPLAKQRQCITAVSSCTSPHGSMCCLLFQNSCAMVKNLFSQYCLLQMIIIFMLYLIKWPKYRIDWQSLVSTHEYHKSGSKITKYYSNGKLLEKISFWHFKLRFKITGCSEQFLPCLVPFLHLSKGDNFSSLSFPSGREFSRWKKACKEKSTCYFIGSSV